MPVHATFDTRAETCIVGTDLLSAVGAEKSELMPPQDAVITVTGQHLECIGLSKSPVPLSRPVVVLELAHDVMNTAGLWQALYQVCQDMSPCATWWQGTDDVVETVMVSGTTLDSSLKPLENVQTLSQDPARSNQSNHWELNSPRIRQSLTWRLRNQWAGARCCPPLPRRPRYQWAGARCCPPLPKRRVPKKSPRSKPPKRSRATEEVYSPKEETGKIN